MGLSSNRSLALPVPMLLWLLTSCAGSTPSQATPTTQPGGEQNQEARLFVNFTVTPEVASDLLGPRPEGEAAREILEIASGYGLNVEQLHPGIEDPLMSRSFFIAVPDQETAQEIIERLKILPSVESVYFTPPGEAPGGVPF